LVAGDAGARVVHLGWLHVATIGLVMLWVAAFLTLLTGWDYLIAGIHHAAAPPAGAGPKARP